VLGSAHRHSAGMPRATKSATELDRAFRVREALRAAVLVQVQLHPAEQAALAEQVGPAEQVVPAELVPYREPVVLSGPIALEPVPRECRIASPRVQL